jgi:hypothetical protein
MIEIEAETCPDWAILVVQHHQQGFDLHLGRRFASASSSRSGETEGHL